MSTPHSLYLRRLRAYDSWKRAGEGAYMFNAPVADMEREELLAVIGYLLMAQRRERVESKRRYEFLAALRGAR